MLEVLKKYDYTGKDDKAYLQCFDADELKHIRNELEPRVDMDLSLVRLTTYTDWNETQQRQPDGGWVNYNYDWMFKPNAMKQVAEYADGIGSDYHTLIEETPQPDSIKLIGMMQDAQWNKLVVYLYTVRSDKLPEYTTDVNQLHDTLYNKAGVNGSFTDFPDKAIKFLNEEQCYCRMAFTCHPISRQIFSFTASRSVHVCGKNSGLPPTDSSLTNNEICRQKVGS